MPFLREKTGRWSPEKTVAFAVVIAPETQLFEHVDVELTLQGLRIVWERNQSREVRGIANR